MLRRSVATPGRDRYSLLLGLLVVCYLLSAVRGDVAVAVARLLVFVAVLLLALHTSGAPRRVFRLLGAVSGLGTVCASALALSRHGDASEGVLHLWTVLVLLVTVLVIVARVLSHPVVSVQTIFGAISAYLVVGMMFAALYAALAVLSGRQFFAQSASTSLPLFQYFSFATLTTLGYGDFTPATAVGRSVAVLEALVGQVFLVTLVARLVSAFSPGQSKQSRRSRRSRRSEHSEQPGHPTGYQGVDPGDRHDGGHDPELSAICRPDLVCLARCG